GEVQLRVGALPEQEVREPLLASGADQEVDVGGAVRLAVRLAQPAGERLARRGAVEAPGRVEDRIPRRVVDGDPQPEPPPARRRLPTARPPPGRVPRRPRPLSRSPSRTRAGMPLSR